MLIESAKTGDDEMVKIILENEEVDVNVEDDYGYTALCYAALKGTNHILRKHLKGGRVFRKWQLLGGGFSRHKILLLPTIPAFPFFLK